MFVTDHLPLVDESAKRDNVAIRTAITANHWRAMYQMIRNGMGIGVVDAFACVDAVASGELVPLLPQYCIPSQDLHLLIRAQRPIPTRVHTVAEIMKQCVPDLLRTLTVNSCPDREPYRAE